jgi:hypothetical protein
MRALIIKIIVLLILIIGAFALYLAMAIKKMQYDYKVTSYTVKSIDLEEGKAIVSLTLDIMIRSSLFFSIPVGFLYYQVFYKGNELGRSTNTKGFTILKNPEPTKVSQSIDIYIDKKNIQIAENFIRKKPTEFTVFLIVSVFGIKLRLKELKFTY